MLTSKKLLSRRRRQRSVRKRITGSDACPRLCVYRSSKHIYAQVHFRRERRNPAECVDADESARGVRAEQGSRGGRRGRPADRAAVRGETDQPGGVRQERVSLPRTDKGTGGGRTGGGPRFLIRGLFWNESMRRAWSSRKRSFTSAAWPRWSRADAASVSTRWSWWATKPPWWDTGWARPTRCPRPSARGSSTPRRRCSGCRWWTTASRTR